MARAAALNPAQHQRRRPVAAELEVVAADAVLDGALTALRQQLRALRAEAVVAADVAAIPRRQVVAVADAAAAQRPAWKDCQS